MNRTSAAHIIHENWDPGPDPLATSATDWVDATPVRAHLFHLSAHSGVPWWVVLDHAGWPRRLARRMGAGPVPRRVPQALADALSEVDATDLGRPLLVAA